MLSKMEIKNWDFLRYIILRFWLHSSTVKSENTTLKWNYYAFFLDESTNMGTACCIFVYISADWHSGDVTGNKLAGTQQLMSSVWDVELWTGDAIQLFHHVSFSGNDSAMETAAITMSKGLVSIRGKGQRTLIRASTVTGE